MTDSLYGKHLYVNIGVAFASFVDGKYEGQYSTDDASPPNVYKWLAGSWVQTGSGGNAHILDPYRYTPVTTVTRYAMHVSASNVAAQIAASPVIAAAADLILWDTFGNSPQRVRFRCHATNQDDVALAIQGWWVFINLTQAQAATELARICDVNSATGIANYVAAGTLDGNTDQGAIFVHPGSDFEYTHAVPITSCVVADTSETLAATGESFLSCYFMPLP